MNLLKGSFFIKIAALVVAVLTYNYIHNEIYNNAENSQDSSYKLIKLTAKSLPVKVRVETRPPDGYILDDDLVEAIPSHVTVIGPEALLEDAWRVETSVVDVSDATKSVKKRVPLEDVAGIHLTGDAYYVDVVIPIHGENQSPSDKPANV